MMKKIVLIFMLLVVCVLACFADISRWSKMFYVDEFGDPTDKPYIRSEVVTLKHGKYVWDESPCYILIDEHSAGLYLDDRIYGEWIIRTKTDDGTTHTFKGELLSTGLIRIKDATAYSLPATFVIDLTKGCRLVATPDNKYADSKYDFGKVRLSLEDLQRVRPDWK